MTIKRATDGEERELGELDGPELHPQEAMNWQGADHISLGPADRKCIVC